MSDDFFDIAIKHDLDVYDLDKAHIASMASMSDVLNNNAWVELSANLSEENLYESYDALVVANDYESLKHWNKTFPKFSPTALQFFFDLYGFGNPNQFSDVLVSYLHEGESIPQNYEIYAADTISDIQVFFSAINDSPALIYPGSFRVRYQKGKRVATTRKQSLRSINGICVDIDSKPFDGSPYPMDPNVLEELLKRIHFSLQPNYICLSGNGIHLWWIFVNPVQTFGQNNPRRRKLLELNRALYTYIDSLLSDLPAEVDFACIALNHGFRAPGTLTKYGDVVRCFCPKTDVFRSARIEPFAFSKKLRTQLSEDVYPIDFVLNLNDVVYKTDAMLKKEADDRYQNYMTRFASDKQLELLNTFYEQGLFTTEQFETFSTLTAHDASELIKDALDRGTPLFRGDVPSRPQWRTAPHNLVAGKTGGVYQTILNNIEQVPIGKRYLSLFMLAGVAYMMSNPTKSKESLYEDYKNLLNTPWAKAGAGLTERDINNALTGYSENNWRTVSSIVDTLGFNPFGPPSKRNGNSRDVHLAKYARPAYAKKSLETNLRLLKSYLSTNPDATKKQASDATGISYPTVLKYWKQACYDLNLEDSRSGNFSHC